MQAPPTYIYQSKEWPHFRWDTTVVDPLLAALTAKQAWLLGRMSALGFPLQEEANLQVVTLDIVKSSEIEGEILNTEYVRSSVARRLGLEAAGTGMTDRHIEGIVEMMLDATANYQQSLSEERLFGWHAALFPTGRSGMTSIVTGNWRNNPPQQPMQVISGMMGREKVHFQAPDAALVADEMFAFLQWFNNNADVNPLLKAAIAHLWFITIHPFDDGNGRIARAITDLQLAKSDGTHLRFYSMSAQIRKERNKYYHMLETTQKSSVVITAWLEWFLQCLGRAMDASKEELAMIMRKASFWKKHMNISMNARQRLMLNKILDGYQGQITSSNWSKITGSSPDTAVRDINDLLTKNILVKGPAGGRSTRYVLSDANSESNFA